MPLIGADKAGPNASNSLQYKVPLLYGTPLALLVVEDGIKGISSTQHTAGLEISLSLSRHPELLKLIHLVPENVVFDATYVIPGLIPESPDVIKDPEYLFKPHLQKCITLTLEKVCIRVQPSVQDAEFKIIEKIREHLDSELNKSSKATIAQRRLQVAVYNGYRFIHEPDYYHLIVEPLVSSAMDNTAKPLREGVLILRSDIKLPNVPDDPDIAVVFLIEYIVSYPGSNGKETSVISSASKAPMSNFGICWGFSTLRSLRANSSENIILTCNPASYPHKTLFVKLANKFEMSFVTFSLSKQNKKSMLPVPSAVEKQSVGSASVQEPQSVEASVMYSPTINHPAQNYKSMINSPSQPFHSIPDYTEKAKTNVSRAFHSIPEYVEKGRTSLEFRENANNMALQEITIVPSSLPLIPPLLHLFPFDSGLPSNTFTKLYWDKLQPVLDHHGKPAVQIDNSVPYSIDRDLELRSPPQKNEYMFQLLAISGLEEYSQLPSEIFFTFQFYRFLSVRS
ncbi:Nephrocystin-4, partial [Stegodyphus mimosarum]